MVSWRRPIANRRATEGPPPHGRRWELAFCARVGASPGYEIDVEKALRACARHDVVVEINAHPCRLDLDWRWHQTARDLGCMFSIDPDARSIPDLGHMYWGVEMARKAGMPAARVLNAMPFAEIMEHVKRKRCFAARAA